MGVCPSSFDEKQRSELALLSPDLSEQSNMIIRLQGYCGTMAGVCSAVPVACMGPSPSCYDERERQDLLRQQGTTIHAQTYRSTITGFSSALPAACLGPSLSEYRDPLRIEGPVRTGLLDVDGDGHVDCHDMHDALFLDYPVDHPPLPDHSADAWKTMLARNKELWQQEVEVEDAWKTVVMRHKETSKQDLLRPSVSKAGEDTSDSLLYNFGGEVSTSVGSPSSRRPSNSSSNATV